MPSTRSKFRALSAAIVLLFAFAVPATAQLSFKPTAEAVQERGADQSHETGGDDEIRLMRGNCLGERHIPAGPVGILGKLDEKGGQSALLGAPQPTGAGAIGANGHDLGGIVGIGSIQQGLQQCPGTGHQDDDPSGDRQARLMHGVLTGSTGGDTQTSD